MWVLSWITWPFRCPSIGHSHSFYWPFLYITCVLHGFQSAKTCIFAMLFPFLLKYTAHNECLFRHIRRKTGHTYKRNTSFNQLLAYACGRRSWAGVAPQFKSPRFVNSQRTIKNLSYVAGLVAEPQVNYLLCTWLGTKTARNTALIEAGVWCGKPDQ